MISFSKSTYRSEHPYNDIYFNANVITINYGKVWYGDLDIDVDRDKLICVAKEIGEPLFVLYEMDARFENEHQSIETLVKKAQVTITPSGEITSRNREILDKWKESGENPYKKTIIPLDKKQLSKIVNLFIEWQLNIVGLTFKEAVEVNKAEWFDKYTITTNQDKEFNERASKYLKRYYKLDEDQVRKLLGEFNLFYGLRIID